MSSLVRPGFLFTNDLLELGTDNLNLTEIEWELLENDARLVQTRKLTLWTSSLVDFSEWSPSFLPIAKRMPNLEVLKIDRILTENAPENRPLELVDPGDFFKPFSRLLGLQLMYVTFSGNTPVHLPHLEALHWAVPYPTSACLNLMFTDVGPKLKILALDFCRGGIIFDPEWTMKDLGFLFDESPSSLKELYLIGTEFSDTFFAAMLKHKKFSLLQVLDISSNVLSIEQLQALSQNASNFKELKTLVLTQQEEDRQEEEIPEEIYKDLQAKFGPDKVDLRMDGVWKMYSSDLW